MNAIAPAVMFHLLQLDSKSLLHHLAAVPVSTRVRRSRLDAASSTDKPCCAAKLRS